MSSINVRDVLEGRLCSYCEHFKFAKEVEFTLENIGKDIYAAPEIKTEYSRCVLPYLHAGQHMFVVRNPFTGTFLKPFLVPRWG